MTAIEPFKGGGRAIAISAGIGGLGLALTAVGAMFDLDRALGSYLFAFTYWLGISVAALILLGANHASGARWMVVIKRPLEVMTLPAGAMAVLFVPILLGMGHLFSWLHPSADLAQEARQHLEHKRLYLNATSFLIRALIYFGVWTFCAERLFGWSKRQDVDGDPQLTLKQRRFGAGMLPFVALTLTFAGFDWLMSLSPQWFSTMFGVYYFAGSFLAAIAVWTLAVVWARGPNTAGALATPQHLHNLGKLLLAFVAFWAYIAFSQYLLIWIANLPEETAWYIPRTIGEWKPVFWLLIVGHFFAPFFILLSRPWKLRRGFLAGMAIYLLVLHAVDLAWVMFPSLGALELRVHWTAITAFVGVGGLVVAYALWRSRGGYAVPVKDPFLEDSLGYTQP